MIVRFFDRQDSRNQHNGMVVQDSAYLLARLDEARGKPPFFCELVGDAGHKLLLGISDTLGCAQYSASDGSPPYLMAADVENTEAEGYMEFLIGNTDTPVPLKFCLPMVRIKQIACDFIATGAQSPSATWEAI